MQTYNDISWVFALNVFQASVFESQV